MGIEPTLSAWEAEVLPLNYARPVPKDGHLPRGACPLRDGLKQACLATGHHSEVSALSSRGNRCIPYPHHYSPAFAFSEILYPQQMGLILQPDLSPVAARLCVGLTLFHATSTGQEDPTFLPVIVLSACPHQAGKHPITYRLVRAYQSIWLVKLDGIYQWFTLCWSFDPALRLIRISTSRVTRRPSRAPHTPKGGYVVSALGTRSLPTPHCT